MATERVPRPERWDEPLDPGMTELDVDRLLELEPFRSIDASKFPASLPFRGILKNDCRLRRFQEGDIVVRQGDYGNTAFYVVRGPLRVVLGGDDNELPAEVLGRLVSNKMGFFDAMGQLWRRSKYPEVRHKAANSGNVVGRRGASRAEDVRIFLQDVPGVLDEHRTATLDAGEFFGEIAALGRTPRTTTVFSHEGAEVLEIRWQGLRDIRRRSEKVREHIDTLYRENSLRSQLRATPLFRHLSPEDLVRLAEATVFETYGTFDWFHGYKKLSQESYAERLATEPVIAEEGSTANGVILVRAGFARMSRKYNHGHRTLSYLSKGQVFGLEEIAHAFAHGEKRPYQSSLRAIGYVDTLLVPAEVMKTLVLPSMPVELLPSSLEEPTAGCEPQALQAPQAPQAWMEFIGDKRLVNGKAAMVINLDSCVRCDDCVRGCADAHDGNPRFVRHGPQQGALQVVNACMHCVDPVCMIGCPTGAIHRDESQGEILINDATCIGCSVCANSCPYDNIRMVPIRDPAGRQLLSEASGRPLLEATKCDLCSQQPSGPACVSACAHDALRRVDLNDWSQLASWLPKSGS